MTNAERIYGMTHAELAAFLHELNASCGCCIPARCLDDDCAECVAKWLESEVEHETD